MPTILQAKPQGQKEGEYREEGSAVTDTQSYRSVHYLTIGGESGTRFQIPYLAVRQWLTSVVHLQARQHSLNDARELIQEGEYHDGKHEIIHLPKEPDGAGLAPDHQVDTAGDEPKGGGHKTNLRER